MIEREGVKGCIRKMLRIAFTSPELVCADKVCSDTYQVHKLTRVLNDCFSANSEYTRHNSEAIKMRYISGSIMCQRPSHLGFRKQFIYRNICVR